MIIYKTTEPQRGRGGWQTIVLTMQVSSLCAVFGGLKVDVRKVTKDFVKAITNLKKLICIRYL